MSSVENSIESNDPLTKPLPFDLDCKNCEKEWIGDCEDHYNNIFSAEYTDAELKEETGPLFSTNFDQELCFIRPESDDFWGHPSVANDSEEEYPLSREDKDKSKEPPTTRSKCIEPTTTNNILNVKPKRKYVRKNRTFLNNNSKEKGELPHLMKKLLNNPEISILELNMKKGCKARSSSAVETDNAKVKNESTQSTYEKETKGNEAKIPSIKLKKKKSGESRASSVYEIDNTKFKNESTQGMNESQTKVSEADIPIIKLKKKNSDKSRAISVYEIEKLS